MLRKILTILSKKRKPLKKALWMDGGQVQISCPYCKEIQINFSTMDLYLDAPDFLVCEFCSKKMKVAAT